MLGFDSKRTLVKGQFAREIRARIRRIQTKQLNEADRREIQSHKKYSNGMSIEWQGPCIENHYCRAYSVIDKDSPDKTVVALFALSFDSLDLDTDDKDEMMSGTSLTSIPQISSAYEDVFLNKPHYPALDIAYLAVKQDMQGKGIGQLVIEAIHQRAQQQDFAGCQFLTVEALKMPGYSAVGFYEKCGFSPCEYPNPNKNTLRMYRTLYPLE